MTNSWNVFSTWKLIMQFSTHVFGNKIFQCQKIYKNFVLWFKILIWSCGFISFYLLPLNPLEKCFWMFKYVSDWCFFDKSKLMKRFQKFMMEKISDMKNITARKFRCKINEFGLIGVFLFDKCLWILKAKHGYGSPSSGSFVH